MSEPLDTSTTNEPEKSDEVVQEVEQLPPPSPEAFDDGELFQPIPAPVPPSGSVHLAESYAGPKAMAKVLAGESDGDKVLLEYETDKQEALVDYDAKVDRDAKAVVEEVTTELALESQTISEEMLANTLNEDLVTAFDNLEKDTFSQAAPYIAHVRNLYPEAPRDWVNRIASDYWLAAETQKLNDEQGTLEQIWNFSSWLLLDTSMYDSADSIFSPSQAAKFQSLDGLTKMSMIPRIMDEAVSLSRGNQEKAEELLRRLMGDDQGAEALLQNSFSTFDIASSVLLVAQVTKALLKSANIVKGLGNIGQEAKILKALDPDKLFPSDKTKIFLDPAGPPPEIEKAGELVAAGLNDSKVAEMIGKTQDELVLDAIPFSFGKLDPATSDFVFSSALDKIENKSVKRYLEVRQAILDVAVRGFNIGEAVKLDPLANEAAYNKFMNEAKEELENSLPSGSAYRFEPVTTEDGALGIRAISTEEDVATVVAPRTTTSSVPSIDKSLVVDAELRLARTKEALEEFKTADIGAHTEKEARELLKGLQQDIASAETRLKTAQKALTPTVTPEVKSTPKAGTVLGQRLYRPSIDTYTGVMEFFPVGKVEAFVLSPAAVGRGTEIEHILNTANRTLNARAGLVNAFEGLSRTLDSNLNKGSGITPFGIGGRRVHNVKANLDEILFEGDQATKVYTQEQLKDGIKTADNRTLKIQTEAEWEYYIGRRAQADAAWAIADKLGIKDAELAGKKALGGFKEGGQPIIGFVKDDLDSISTFLRGVRGEIDQANAKGGDQLIVPKVFDSDLGDFRTLDEVLDDLEGIVGNDRVLFDLSKDKGIFVDPAKAKSIAGTAGSNAEYVLAKRSEINDLPHVGLKPHRKGWIPKENLGAEFAVIKTEDGLANGVKVVGAGRELVQLFSTRKAAERAAARLGNDHEVLSDYERIAQLGDNESSFKAAKHKGNRKEDEILLDGSPIKQVAPADALDSHMGVLAEHIPIDLWRKQQEAKFVSSINADPRFKTISSFNDPLIIDNAAPGARGILEGAEYTRDYVRSVTLSPTPDERAFSSMMRGIAEVIEPASDMAKVAGLRTSVARTAMHMSHSDPITAIKGITFNAYLGFLNPAQLFVQAQMASIALALHPIRGIIQTPRAMALTAAYFSRNQSAIDILFKGVKSPKITTKALDEDLKLLQQTDIMESLVRTGEYQAARQGYGQTMKGMKALLNAGLAPYKGGEGFSRVFAFLISKDEWVKANKGKAIDKEALDEIVIRQQQLTMQMLETNRANFQKGIIGVPTQFWQVQTKFVENLTIRDTFSGTEKAKIIVGQVILYGAAGMAFGDVLVNMASQLTGMSNEELSTPSELTGRSPMDAFRAGLVGYITGNEANFSARAGILSSFKDTIENIIVGGNKSVMENLLGAFGGIVKAELAALTTWNDLLNMQEATGEDLQIALPVIIAALRGIKTIDNLAIASFMARENSFFVSRGVPIPYDFTLEQVLLKGFGFSPTVLSDLNTVIHSEKETKELFDALSNRMVKAIGIYETHTRAGSQVPIDEVAFLEVMMSGRGGTMIDHAQLYKITMNKILNGQSKESETLRKALEADYSAMTNLLGLPLGDKVAAAELVQRTKESN